MAMKDCKMAPVDPVRELARVLVDVPSGAEIHAMAVVVVYQDGEETLLGLSRSDAISGAGADLLGRMLARLQDRAEGAADTPPYQGE
jgi:hypothetical protein